MSFTVYAIGADEAVGAAARNLAAPGVNVSLRPRDHSHQEILGLKQTIESDRDELRSQGVVIHGLGVVVEDNGPRVAIGLLPDTGTGRDELGRRYGVDAISAEPWGDVVPQ